MTSLILKATTLALGAAMILSTAGTGAAEAKRGNGGHRVHGHSFLRFVVYQPIVIYTAPSCYWKWGKKVCKH